MNPQLPTTLTYNNAKIALKAGRHAIDLEEKDVTFNLSHLQIIDSSAIAVLLDWKKYCNTKNTKNTKSIHFTGASEQLINLATIYGVNELLF